MNYLLEIKEAKDCIINNKWWVTTSTLDSRCLIVHSNSELVKYLIKYLFQNKIINSDNYIGLLIDQVTLNLITFDISKAFNDLIVNNKLDSMLEYSYNSLYAKGE